MLGTATRGGRYGSPRRPCSSRWSRCYVWGGGPSCEVIRPRNGRPSAIWSGDGAVPAVGDPRRRDPADDLRARPAVLHVAADARALIAVAVINIVPVAGWALLWWPSDQDVFFNVLFAVVTLVFSVAVGTWIIRIIEQSQERAELIAELDASRHEVSRLSAAHGALAERERMAREIHDTLAQGFTSLLMLVQAVEAELDHDVAQARRHLALMDETARQNLAEARALVAGGAPADLAGASLPDALRRLAARQRRPSTSPAPYGPCPPVPRWSPCGPARRHCPTPAGTRGVRRRSASRWRTPMTPSPCPYATTAAVSTPGRRRRDRWLRSGGAAGPGHRGRRDGPGAQRARRRHEGDRQPARTVPRGAHGDPDHPGRRPSRRTGGTAGDAERRTRPGGRRRRVQRAAGGGAGRRVAARHRADGPADAGWRGRGLHRADESSPGCRAG